MQLNSAHTPHRPPALPDALNLAPTLRRAIVGGGIGLLLTQAIITQKDWEEVTYYIILIVMMVFVMDSLSGWLRRRLIKGGV